MHCLCVQTKRLMVKGVMHVPHLIIMTLLCIKYDSYTTNPYIKLHEVKYIKCVKIGL
jgi:hypothetical protein